MKKGAVGECAAIGGVHRTMRCAAALFAAVSAAALAVTGCAKNGESAEGGQSSTPKTTVTFWTLSTSQPAVEGVIESFSKLNPDIEVKAAFYTTDGFKDACKVAASSKTLPNMWTNWGGALGGFYSDNGLTYDLTDYAKEHGWYDKFAEGPLALCTRGGKITGYPGSYNVITIYYRKDIFNSLGLSVPTTFEEFENVCATIKDAGITPIVTAGKYGWHLMRLVELFIEYYAGPELHDSMNEFKASYNCDAVVKALTKYKEFVDKRYFPSGFVSADPDDTRMAFFSRGAAMDLQGQWYDGMIIQDEQDINNYGTFAFPTGGTNRVSAFAGMTQFNASNTPEELEACMKFTEYYNSQENADKYPEYYHLPLPYKDSPMPEGQPNVPEIFARANKNGTFTITDQALPTQVADVLFNMQAAIANKETTPEKAAEAIAKAVDAYKAK